MLEANVIAVNIAEECLVIRIVAVITQVTTQIFLRCLKQVTFCKLLSYILKQTHMELEWAGLCGL